MIKRKGIYVTNQCFSSQVSKRREYIRRSNDLMQGNINRPNYGVIGDHTGNQIVDRVLIWIDKATYNLGACSPSGVFDCSGLVAYAVTGSYHRIGTTLNFVQSKSSFPWVVNPRPGDIVIRHTSDQQHCGVFYCPGLMIEASDLYNNVGLTHFDPNKYRYCRYEGD